MSRRNKWDDVEVPEKRRPRDLAAGHTRDEVSRKVKDQLDEEADVLEAKGDVMALDLGKLKPDREIIQVLHHQNVSGAQPGYVYVWVRYKADRGPVGLQVDQKLLYSVKVNGGIEPVWEIVSGSMPECREREVQSAERYRVIGDTLLMRAKQENYDALMTHFEFEHEKRIGTTAKNIQEFAENKQIKLHTFDSVKGFDERGMMAAKSAVSNMKRNHRLDLGAANAIIAEAEKKGDANLPFLKIGLKQMLGMQVAQQYVEKRIREGTLIMKGD